MYAREVYRTDPEQSNDFCFIDKTFNSVLELYNILLYLQYDAIKRSYEIQTLFAGKCI